MVREALFIVFHGFDPNNGISKKISYQIDAISACGLNTHLCYMDEGKSKCRMVDGQVIADYGNGLKSKVLKRKKPRKKLNSQLIKIILPKRKVN